MDRQTSEDDCIPRLASAVSKNSASIPITLIPIPILANTLIPIVTGPSSFACHLVFLHQLITVSIRSPFILSLPA